MTGAHPATVHDRIGLAIELEAMRKEKGISLREVGRRAEALVKRENGSRASRGRSGEGGRTPRFVELPRTTVWDFLRTGNLTFAQFDTFVTLCGVSDDERLDWMVAWRRATGPSPPTTVVGSIPGEAVCFRERAAASTLRGAGRRRPGGHYVVTGLGGVGKTQLAASFAMSKVNSRDAYVVVWSSASSRDAIVGTYALAAQSLRLPGAGDGDLRAAAAFLSWCASTSRPWVVVLDDLSGPAAIEALWPPVVPTGQVLVTTRRRDVTLLDTRTPVPVDAFTADEARDYLVARLPGSSDDDVDGVARDLGFLPLALSHASAYMLEAGMTCTDYRRVFASASRRLPDVFLAKGESFDTHAATVATTWLISIEQANNFVPNGLAAPLLDLASFLDPSAVPVAVLTAPATVQYLARRRGGPVSVREAEQGRFNLRRLHLLDEESQAVRTHSLVQRAVRERLADEDADAAASAAADALMECWPEVDRDPALAATLRANATALRKRRVSAVTLGAVHPVLFRATESAADVGQHRSAIDTIQELLAEAESRLGADHRDTLSLRNSLADLHGRAGDPVQAVALLEAVLPDLRRHLGEDHPGTLAARFNRAHWLGQAGRPAEAVRAAEDLLADRLRLVGPDDRTAMASRDQVSRWRGAAGDVRGALAEARDLLDDQVRVLGPTHQDTLTTRNNLATWLGESGDAAAAAAEFGQLVADRTAALGRDHPHTLVARNNELNWRGVSGDAAGAAEGYAEFVTDIERVLGPDHVNTLATRGNMARWRAEAGDLVGAIEAGEHLLADQTRGLVRDHPHLLVTRQNIATWRGRNGDVAAAVADMAGVLADRERVLGPDHPDTLHTRSELARWRAESGDPSAPLGELEAVLADQRRVLGPDHPQTLRTRLHLAVVRGRASNDPDVALTELDELVPDLERVFGPDHSLVDTARREAADWRGPSGRR